MYPTMVKMKQEKRQAEEFDAIVDVFSVAAAAMIQIHLHGGEFTFAQPQHLEHSPSFLSIHHVQREA